MKGRLFFFLYLLLCQIVFGGNPALIRTKTAASKVIVEPIKINTEFSEFSPYLVNNTLFFISNRNEKLGLNYTSNDQNTADIYSCERIDATTFSKPKPVVEINTIFDDGPISFNASGNLAVFSASNKKGKLQLYYSEKVNGKWGAPILHPVSRANDSYCHPVLSEDGNLLIFCSDLQGGYGGMDIYYSKRNDLTWSNPKNLGASINTASNEVFPFLEKGGILYFSSTRKSGLGGLDIYKITLKDSSNQKAQMLESPYNSVADDFGIVVDSSHRSGYFSSNRIKDENDNLFYFETILPDFSSCETVKKNSCFTFMKDEYSLPENATESEYEWDFGDGNKNRARAVKHCYNAPGFYSVKLNVVEKLSGKLIYNELAYTIAVRPQGLTIDVKDTLYINTAIQLDASKSSIEGFKILSYNWVFSDTSFAKGAKVSHSYSQNGIYLVELGVEAQNSLTKELKKFCIDKWILVGDEAYIEKNLRQFKFAELNPDAESLYFMDESSDPALVKQERTFRYTTLKEDAYKLTGEELDDEVLSLEERKLLSHKFSLLQGDNSTLESMGDDDVALKARARLLRLKGATLPPIVDTLYIPQPGSPVSYKVNLGWSDNKLDKNSSVFEGINKLEETKEGNKYRYTSGNEKLFADIVPYYENAQKRGFKDAAVVGYEMNGMSHGQVKDLKAILFDSASVEKHALKVYFKYNVATYDKKYNQQIDSLLRLSTKLQNQKVLLITHFDGIGSEAYNINLNTQRTNNMVKYLTAKGVRPNQIKTEFILHPTEKLEPDLLRRIEVFIKN